MLLPAGAYVVALHGSLQHELLHGHPTGWRWLNDLLARPGLWLWLPYGIYRDSHIVHHRTDRLTCPVSDPESNYVLPAQWQAMGRLARAVHLARKTVLGRLVLGPPVAVKRLLGHELPRLIRGDALAWRQWAAHAAVTLPLLYWVIEVCGIPFWGYVAFFAYPGLGLALLRSFTEHRPHRNQAHATAIVETSWPMALLYLNNNLHAVHHERPGVAWYGLPALYRAEREAVLRRNGNFLFRGYGEILRRYFLTPRDAVPHPFYRTPV
ncbi:MAG: fatty acid desaturase [Alphaproteobacteria bacterium]|nr:fatty acid desaturase [Alphaproteobacteria bacterium]